MWQDHNLLRTDSAIQASYPSHFKQKMCTSLLGKWPTTTHKGLFIDLAEVFTGQQNFHRLTWGLLYSYNGASSPRQGPSRIPPGLWYGPDLEPGGNVQSYFSILFLKTPLRTWSLTLCIWCTRCTTAVKTGFQLKWEYGGHHKRLHRFCSITHICQKWTFWHLVFFSSLHSVCVIMTQTSLPYALVHSLGSFTWKKNTRQRLLSFFYNFAFIT